MATPSPTTAPSTVDGAIALARWLQDEGNEGLVLAGTTGEAPTLTDAEKLALWEAVAEAVTIPAIAGSTTADTAHAVHLTAEASQTAASPASWPSALLQPAVATGIEGHLRAVAEATDLPALIYDIPIRTGRKITTELLARLAHEVDEHRRRQGRRRQPHDGPAHRRHPGRLRGLQRRRRDDLPLLAVGAVGLIGVATHCVASDVVELFDRWDAGDTHGAHADFNDRLLESWAFRPATRRRTRDRQGRRCYAPPRPARRPLPPPDGRRPPMARRPGRRGPRQPDRRPWLTRPDAAPNIWAGTVY